jgi:N-acetylated-alpha-linked acidic dipeptidase
MIRNWTRLGYSSAIATLLALGPEVLRGSEPVEARARGQSSAAGSSPLGFSPRSRAAQLRAEAHALAVPTPENARRWLRTLTAEPHVAGTHADYKTAIFVRDKLREWGWKAELEELEVLLNYPTAGEPPTLYLRRPTNKRLSLDEAPLATD